MIDRAIGVLGLALAFIFGVWSIAPTRFPALPMWVIRTGISIGIFLVGLAAGLLISNQRSDSKPQSTLPPNLMLSMLGGNVFEPDAKDMHNRLTGIGINAKIWNTGAPSVATEWSLSVIPEKATPVIAQLTKIPETLRLSGSINSAVIRSSESLEDKTKTAPVQATPVEGTLLFYAPIKREMVLAPSTRLELIVKDIEGKETKITKVMGDWLHR
jgi:hypothetical protein